MRISAYTRLTRTQKSTAVGLAAAAGVAALTAGVSSGPSAGGEPGHSPAKPVAGHSVSADSDPGKKPGQILLGDHATDDKSPAGKKAKSESVRLVGASYDHRTKADEGPKAEEKDRAEAKQKKAEAKADVKAEQRDRAKEARTDKGASRAADRATKGDNLDGWIKQARAIMKEEGIPGSYHGIKKNIMRESGGNPNAVNDWDINAKKGTPSKGLLQTIKPTFDRYHVDGTANSMTDPVANITAACNYAADRYGSMDNVNSAY